MTKALMTALMAVTMMHVPLSAQEQVRQGVMVKNETPEAQIFIKAHRDSLDSQIERIVVTIENRTGSTILLPRNYREISGIRITNGKDSSPGVKARGGKTTSPKFIHILDGEVYDLALNFPAPTTKEDSSRKIESSFVVNGTKLQIESLVQ